MFSDQTFKYFIVFKNVNSILVYEFLIKFW